MKQYLGQSMEDGSCCFVIAVANCLIHLGLPVPDLEECKDVAGCRHGPTIYGTLVVQFMDAPLVRESDGEEVLRKGGVLCIMHPIFNGHAVFVFPECYPDRITMINSWLGPTVINGIAAREIRPFIINKMASHWTLMRPESCGREA